MAETKYGGTVTKCEEEESSSRWWEQLQQNYENQSLFAPILRLNTIATSKQNKKNNLLRLNGDGRYLSE